MGTEAVSQDRSKGADLTMLELTRIGDLAATYGISSRTLRYYEEIGLLRSERRDASQQRYYDREAVSQLEEILLLRQLELPIKEIQAVLATRDLRVAVEAFTRKLKELDAEIVRLSDLRGVVEAFLWLLQERGYARPIRLRLLGEKMPLVDRTQAPAGGATKEAVRMLENPGAVLDHVRLIQLKPMQVAFYRAESPSPELDAWGIMNPWVAEQGLADLPATRYFGFNNPNPSAGQAVYGYEVWVAVPEGTASSGPVHIKPFAGGLYAVVPTYLYEIGERWQKLVQWVLASDQVEWESARPCLEESIDHAQMGAEQAQLDLFLPVRRK
jgi:DNA-binding transcriptional MerR regulator/DNA gyrase inhibitor GyrI